LNHLTTRDCEPAKRSWSSIIGMTFQLSAQLKESIAVEWVTTQGIQPVQKAEPHRCAATQPAAARHIFANRTRKSEGTKTRLLEETFGSVVKHLWHPAGPGGAFNPNKIVEAHCDTQAIEPRAEIRDARRNANSNPIHVIINLSSRLPAGVKRRAGAICPSGSDWSGVEGSHKYK